MTLRVTYERMDQVVARVVLGTLLWLVSTSVLAGLTHQTPRFARFNSSNGLPSSQVLQLAHDPRGYVWAATAQGLVRLDGHSVQVWRHEPGQVASLPGNYVEALALDEEGRVLLGINGWGLVRLSADGRGVETFPEVRRTCGSQVWSLATRGDEIWLGLNGDGLCIVQGNGEVRRITVGKTQGQLRNGKILALRPDIQGRMWIGTFDGVWSWHDGRLEEEAPGQLAGTAVVRITHGDGGITWVGTDSQLWQLVDGEPPRTITLADGSPLRHASVLQNPQGEQWIGTSHGLYWRNGVVVQAIAGDAGRGFLNAGSMVLDIVQDHEGGAWFALNAQGLAYLPSGWRRFAMHDVLDGQPLETAELKSAIPYKDGFLVVGVGGVFRLHASGQLRKLADSAVLGKGAVWSILAISENELWLGRGGRITRMTPEGRLLGHVSLPAGVASERVELMVLADDGTVWLSIVGVGLEQRTMSGVLLRRLRKQGPEGLPRDLVHQMRFAEDGSLWLATGAGVYRWDGLQVRPVTGIAGEETYDLAFVWHRQVWVATKGAVTRYHWDGGKARVQQRVGPEHGMPPSEIGGLAISDGGKVWATTGSGLLMWSGTPPVRRFGLSDGLQDVEFSDLPPAYDGKRMLALSYSGLTHFDMDLQETEAVIPLLMIEEVAVRRAGQLLRERADPSVPVRIAPDDGELLIRARLISFTPAHQQRYRFLVEGIDRDWVVTGQSGERYVSNLPPGHYRVQVQARNGEGAWMAAAPVSIIVLPAWWQAWQTQWGAGLLLLVISVVVMRETRRRRQQTMQVRMLVHQQQVTEKASRDKSHFLAMLGHEVRTPMSGILGMSELLQEQVLSDSQREQVADIQRSGERLLRLLDDALDLAALDVGSLVLAQDVFALEPWLTKLHQQVVHMMVAHQVELVSEVQLPGVVFLAGDEKRLLQLVSNLLVHLIKVTCAAQVCHAVRVEASGRAITLVMHDGLSEAEAFDKFLPWQMPDSRDVGAGIGLEVAQSLSVAMQGVLERAVIPGRGTCIRLQLPLVWSLSQGGMREYVQPVASGAALNILVVEDDRTTAGVIVRLLKNRGHQVTHAADGLQALTAVATDYFDVALLDLELPGMDGLTLARQLRAMGLKLPLLAVTGCSDASVEAAVHEAGMDAYVRKPVTGVLLAEAMVSMLRHASTMTEREDA